MANLKLVDPLVKKYIPTTVGEMRQWFENLPDYTPIVFWDGAQILQVAEAFKGGEMYHLELEPRRDS